MNGFPGHPRSVQAMPQLGIFLCMLLVLAIASADTAQARVRYHKLTPTEENDLLQSQRRLAIEEWYLADLDQKLAHHRVSLREYSYQEHDLTAMIASEAKYQNDIMVDYDPAQLSEEQRELIENIVHYGVIMPFKVVCHLFGGDGDLGEPRETPPLQVSPSDLRGFHPVIVEGSAP